MATIKDKTGSELRYIGDRDIIPAGWEIYSFSTPEHLERVGLAQSANGRFYLRTQLKKEAEEQAAEVEEVVDEWLDDTLGEARDPLVGVKHDEGKNRLDLIHPEFLHELGLVMTDGAKEYGDYNWMKGMDWGRVLGALKRHINAWHAGEECALDSGHHHMAHAAACCMFLMIYEREGLGNDDRPSKA
jgi:hypothetical protein